ncbi:MAG: hypothetical protein Q7U35_09280 [Methanobacteriaceae archaeon]|nr:hypothetical protein [Methanobacteriaceae archaeon]MDP2836000.1 hypothetical protein [Methanobacteriaceae archaeon]MDP3035774.1 hypothetical protein [Methanobacteriaceae archaeon]MDP3484071.1 hypothetical protein [Methanobacteriaceae archaeon]MDP3622824.1 hypothetical protein [Methanobacteriaceae archaeon]
MVNKKTLRIIVIVIFLAIISTILVNGAGNSSKNFQKSNVNSSIKNNISCGSCDDFNGNSMNSYSKVVSSVENYNNSTSISCCQ